jgi:hypothetical protein
VLRGEFAVFAPEGLPDELELADGQFEVPDEVVEY